MVNAFDAASVSAAASAAVILLFLTSAAIFAFASANSAASGPRVNGAPVVTRFTSSMAWANENAGGRMPSAAAARARTSNWSNASSISDNRET